MPWNVVTAAIEYPVTLDEAKEQVRQDLTVDDNIIFAKLGAAVEYGEKFQGQVYCTTTFDEYFECFPTDVLELTLTPVSSITSITYLDTLGASQTWASSKWQSDTVSTRTRIKPVPDETWPLTEVGRMNAVTVRYVAGFGTMADVPKTIKEGFLMKLADLFENRGEDGTKTGEAAMNMLSLDRNLTFG